MTFKFRIERARDADIIIGVVDYEKQKDQRSSAITGNAMGYYGQGGWKFPEVIKEGHGFK